MKKRIDLDCNTRWNSTYEMLSTALLYQDVFDRLAAHAPSVPTQKIGSLLETFVTNLRCFMM
jgi:hypothetical protein